MSVEKRKHKTRLKEYKDDEIHKEDERTFYIKDYMIYNSERMGWTCDCKDFMFGNSNCKHIQRVKALT